MTEAERQMVLAHLEIGSSALVDALDGVTEDMAVRVPGPGRWSVLECIEHVAVAEENLLNLIQVAQWAETPLINEERESRIVARGGDRGRRVESPDGVKPTGRFASLPAAIQHFLSSRKRTLAFVETCGDDLRKRVTSHPMFGTVSCFEMLLLMAMHPHRHAKQIEEIKAALAQAE